MFAKLLLSERLKFESIDKLPLTSVNEFNQVRDVNVGLSEIDNSPTEFKFSNPVKSVS